MKSDKKTSVAVAVFVAAAVIFFLVIVLVVFVSPSSDVVDRIEDPDVTFTSMNVNVVWKDDRSCHITQSLTTRFEKSFKHGIVIDIPVNNGEKVRKLSVKASSGYGTSVPYEFERENLFSIIRVRVGSEDSTFNYHDTLDTVLEYDYITPVHPQNENILDLNVIGGGWASVIESARVSVTFPSKIKDNVSNTAVGKTLGVWVGDGKRTPTVSADGKTYSLNVGELNPFTAVRFKYMMPDGVLKSYSSAGETTLAIVLSLIVAGATCLLMFLFGREKTLTPVVDFYPPRIDADNGEKRHMLPVQMGKLIDGTCSGEDVTSLIFYWASKGYIEIFEADGDTYLIKKQEIKPVRAYERNMFNKLFAKAKEDGNGELRVSVESLSGKFSDCITATKSCVNAEFGTGKLYSQKHFVLSVAVSLLAAALALGFGIFTSFRVAPMFFNFIGVLTLVPVAIGAGCGHFIARNYIKLTKEKRMLYLGLLAVGTILFSVGVMLAIPTDVMSWTEKFFVAAGIGITSVVAPFITRRTAWYDEQLNNILGFRNFLRDAEKERLEMLLADDPQYYYDILPYANVLGVSDIWEDKFKGMTLEPPTYYRGGSGLDIFDIMILHRLSHSVGHSLSYTPPRSPSAGSFSGGGGGFHGGGGGGGFGGGGGHSW